MVRGLWHVTCQTCSSSAWTHLMYLEIKTGFWRQNYRSCAGALTIRRPCSAHKKEHMHINLAGTIDTPCPTAKVNFTCTAPGSGKVQSSPRCITRTSPFHAENPSAVLFWGHHLNGQRHYQSTNVLKIAYAEMHSKFIITDSPFLMFTTAIILILIIKMLAATSSPFGKIHSVSKIVLLVVFPQAASTILEVALG